MGKIYQRGSTWWGEWHTPDGERVRKTLRTKDRKVALTRLRAAELAPSRQDAAGLEAILDRLIRFVRVERSEATVHYYEQKSRQLVRIFGDVRVDAITADDVRAYVAQRVSEGQSLATAKKEIVTLKTALRRAQREGVLIGDTSQVEPPDVRYVPRRVWLSMSDLAKLIAAAPEVRRRWIALAGYAGLRLGEVERVEWGDLQSRPGWLSVRGSKTAGSSRMVPVSKALRSVLGKAPKAGGLIVAPWRNVTRDLGILCDGLELQRVTANDLRRSFASALKQAGVDSLTVAHLLGHSSTTMVDRVYGRLSQDTYTDAVARLDCAAFVQKPARTRTKRGTIEKTKRTRKKSEKTKTP